jgi:hypothetical protein
MRVKSLCHIRSTANPNREMAVETACIPDPQVAWVWSAMTEAKIQVLVDRGAAPVEDRGGVEGGGWGRVSK